MSTESDRLETIAEEIDKAIETLKDEIKRLEAARKELTRRGPGRPRLVA